MFKEYLINLKSKDRAGVAVCSKSFLIILPKCFRATEHCPDMQENQLLIIVEDLEQFYNLQAKVEKITDSMQL